MGIIFNRVAGTGHLNYLREAMASLPSLECFGGIPVRNEIRIYERHLGLTVAEEGSLPKRIVDQLALLIEQHIDLDRLLRKTQSKISAPAIETKTRSATDKRPLIAIASDKAFCFYYRDNLQLIEAAGAKLKFFSPMINANPLPEPKAFTWAAGTRSFMQSRFRETAPCGQLYGISLKREAPFTPSAAA